MNHHDSPTWYPIEASSQVLPEQITLGLLLGHELALWRTRDGALRVWDNRCPHRSVRLTLGLIVDDQLACRYHGWRYGADGQCSSIPANPGVKPPSAACVKTYRHLEQDGVIWASLDEQPAGRPPRLPTGSGFVRSHVLAAPLEALCDSAADIGFERPFAMQLSGPLEGSATTLLLQPMEAALTAVHHWVQNRYADAPDTGQRLSANEALKPLLARWSREPAHV